MKLPFRSNLFLIIQTPFFSTKFYKNSKETNNVNIFVLCVFTEEKELIRSSRQFSRFVGTPPCSPPPSLRHCIKYDVQEETTRTFRCIICEKKCTSMSQAKSHVANAHLKKAYAQTKLKVSNKGKC